MYQYGGVIIRKFRYEDIPLKVKWVNNPENNQFLHYDIPIDVSGTQKWFLSHIRDKARYDAVIEVDGKPVGTIGLLSIDQRNRKAEYYIAMGEPDYKGKGIAKKASMLLLKYGFENLDLNRIYLFTEIKNEAAQRLFERVGFVKEGILRHDIISHGKYVDRIVYGYLREDWRG